jgi:hypothetical protein
VSKKFSKFDIVLYILNFGPLVLIPIFASLFARAMKSDNVQNPIYKKNLQRLIERTRQFEEARNEPRS